MSSVLTLIGLGAESGVAEVASKIATTLQGQIDWLAEGIAADVFFDAETGAAAPIAAEALSGRPGIDAVIQPTRHRRKKLLVADMESTVIANEILDEMADLVGRRDEVAIVTQRAMNGELDFASSLRARVALFRGQPASLLTQAAKRIRFNPGAAALVRTMRKSGAHAVLVSGGFTAFSAAVRDALGFEQDYANELLVENGRIAGLVREPILDGAGKAAALRRGAAGFGIDMIDALAVGDGANDLPMLESAGIGIAYHAKPHVQARSKHRIDHADLTALLYVQGYRRNEFARD